MTEPKPLRIFISSPGDVGEERVIADRVINRLSGEFGQFLDVAPVFWEHEPLRATGHFQEQITPPSKTDVVICILWSRLGTRLPEGFTREDGTPYASGTEWEFEDAARSYREKGTPDLLVYRKTREAVAGLGDEQALLQRLEQKKALDAFIERWFGSADDSFKAAFHAFDSAGEFESLLETHLRKLIQDQLPEHLTGADDGAARVSWHKGSPFRGLEAFEVEHAPVFFGRTRAVGEVKQAIEAQAARGTAFLTVFGMSGNGKSSLVHAGLLPTISQPGVVEGIGLWRWSILRPSDATGDLFDGLAQALLGETALPELSALNWDRERLAEQFREAPKLAAQPIEQALTKATEREALAAGAEARLALVVDQMEELFTLDRVDAAERSGFIAVLAALAKSGLVWVIGAMRSDFYHRCAEAPELVALSEGAGQYHLVPPSPAEIAQIIRNSAKAAGLGFEVAADTGERLDDVLHAAAAHDPASLPLLEFTLEELFKLRGDDGVLTFDAYERLGGLEGALARRAEAVFGGLSSEAREALPAVLRTLVTVGAEEEQPVAARRVALSAVAGTPERKSLVNAFVEARLLVTDRADDGTAVVRVAHEALLSHWPRLQEWLEDDREFLRARARVATAATHWRQEGETADLLLPEGKPLAEAEGLLERHDELELELIAYIDTSVVAYRKRLEAGRAAERRRFRVASAAAVVLGLLAIGTGGAGYVAYQKSVEAERQNITVESQRNSALRTQSSFLADLSNQQTDGGDAGTGLLLALEALPKSLSNAERPYVVEAELALYRAASQLREIAVFPAGKSESKIPDYLHRVVFSPDGSRLVTTWKSYTRPVLLEDKMIFVRARIPIGDNSAWLWDAGSGKKIAVLAGHDDTVSHAAFSPNGKRIITTSSDKSARLWDAATGDELAVLGGRDDEVASAAFGPDGSRIVSWGDTARLWDAMSGKEIAALARHDDDLRHASFSPDGSRIVTASWDKMTRLWDAVDGREVAVLRGYKGPVRHTAFSPDGSRIVTVSSGDNTARLWDAISGNEMALLAGHKSAIRQASFSADGSRIVTVSSDKTARIWNATTGAKIAVLAGHHDVVQRAMFNRDASRVLTIGSDKRTYNVDRMTVRLWDATTGKEVAQLGGHNDNVRHIPWSPQGDRILTVPLDGTARLWDAATGKEVAVLAGHKAWIKDAAFSPDGSRIITASADGTARLWRAASGTALAVLAGHSDEVEFVSFSPDGSRIVTTSLDKSARLWDAGTLNMIAELPRPRHQLTDRHRERDRDTPRVEFSHDGRRIVTTSNHETARLWDGASGQRIAILEGHNDAVWHAVFSPDDTRIVTASLDKTARLWDGMSGAPIAILAGHEDEVKYASFSPDGRRIVTASNDGTARLWDAMSGEEMGVLAGHTDGVRQAMFSPDGGRIVTASDDGTARLWDGMSGEEMGVLAGHTDGVRQAMFSPDGGRIVTASVDGTAQLWNATSGKEIAVIGGHKSRVNDVGFSSDGRSVVAAIDDRTVRILDAKSGKEIAVLTGHTDQIERAEFSPDGGRIVTASDDGTARLWDAMSGEEMAVLMDNEFIVNSAKFSPDGRQIVTASILAARLWDATTGREIAILDQTFGHESYVAFFSPDGGRIVTAPDYRPARLWDATSGKKIAILATPWHPGIRKLKVVGRPRVVGSSEYTVSRDILFSPDGRYLLTKLSDDQRARLWDAATGTKITALASHDDDVLHAAFSPDGHRIITAARDGMARVWDVMRGEEIAVLAGHDDSILHAAFGPDSNRIVTVSRDGTARTWDATSGRQIAVLSGHKRSVVFATFSPDGGRIVTASRDATARVWDAISGEPTAILGAHTDAVEHAEFSPDGRRIVTASVDGTARIWDSTSGREIAVLTGHTARLGSATYNVNGDRILTVSSDQTARLWDAASGYEIAIFTGPNKSISAAAFSPDGERIVTASEDGTAWLWEATNGKEIAVLSGHSAPINSATFSLDGHHIVTASDDGTVRLWDGIIGKSITVIGNQDNEVARAAFGPAGSRIATVSSTDTVHLWRVHPRGQELLDYAHSIAPRQALTMEQRKRFFLDPE